MWIGYWHLDVELYDYLDDIEGENAEQFIWEVRITQDGYRCWYMQSDILSIALDKAIAWARDREYIMDTEVW